MGRMQFWFHVDFECYHRGALYAHELFQARIFDGCDPKDVCTYSMYVSRRVEGISASGCQS